MIRDNLSAEEGARQTLADLGIKEPRTSAEIRVILLSRKLDRGVEAKEWAPINREIRLTLEEVASQVKPAGSEIDSLIAEQ